jgi:hypothetical protein
MYFLPISFCIRDDNTNANLPSQLIAHYHLVDVAKLYANKQQILSQFNENTLVKGVSRQQIVVLK